MTLIVDNQPWPVGYTYAYFDLTFATKNGPETFPGTIDLSKFTLYFKTLNGMETNVFVTALMPPSFTTADEAIWGPVPFNITARGL